MTGIAKYQNFVVVGSSLLLIAVAISMVQYKVPTIMMSIMTRFDLTAAGGSWLMSIFALVTVFCAIALGSLSQRVNPKVMMLGAAGLTFIGSLIGAFTQIGWILIASRAVEGLALAIITICAPIIIERSVSPARIGSALGIYGVWPSLGSGIASITTPILFMQFGFTVFWLEYAVFLVVTVALMSAIVRFPKEAEAATDSVPSEKPRYRELLTRNVFLYMVGFAAVNICILAIASFIPTILQMRGVDITLSGILSTLPMMISILSAPVLGMLSDKIGNPKWLLVAAFAFVGPCAFLMLTQSLEVVWGAAVVMGLFGLGCSGLLVVGLLRVIKRPELLPIALGVLTTVQGLGQFLGTFVFQLLLGPDFSQHMAAGVAILAIGVVGTVCFALCKMNRQASE